MQYQIDKGDELILHTYLPTSVHDWALIDLWGKMQQDGSLEGSILTNSQSLMSFCRLLAEPGETRFAIDERGPYFCAWNEPVMSGVSLGLWIREDKRKSRQCLIFGHQVLAELFKRYPTILVITRNEQTRRFHEHFGFQFACEIPHIYDGDTAYISYLTHTNYTRKFQGVGAPLDQDTLEEAQALGQFIQNLAQMTGKD